MYYFCLLHTKLVWWMVRTPTRNAKIHTINIKMGDEKVEIDYFLKDEIKKDAINTSRRIARHVWPDRWGFIVPMYKELDQKLEKGQRKPLPSKQALVSEKGLEPFMSKSEPKRPLPTYSRMYGWTTDNSAVLKTDFWCGRRAKVSMYGQLGWHWDSQH